MRFIKWGCLEDMKSPIRHVMKNTHRGLADIAPEKHDAFKDVYHTFTLEYLDTFEWVLRVDIKTSTISISRKVVEIMWAAGLYNWVHYQRMCDHDLAEGYRYDLEKDVEIRDAWKLFDWAMEGWVNRRDAVWPSECPAPSDQLPSEPARTPSQIATQLAYGSTAFLIHHELAHIKCAHSGGIEDEKEADMLAAEWVFDGVGPDSKVSLESRGFAVATALCAVLQHDTERGRLAGKTHPPAYNRLLHTLDPYFPENDHPVWLVVIAALHRHFSNSQIEGSPRDIVEIYIEGIVATMSN